MKIFINYFFQNDEDKSLNSIEAHFPGKTDPNELEKSAQILIKDIIGALPFARANLVGFHFRFKSICEEAMPSMMAWIDIANMNARAPFIDNMVTVKVLRSCGKQKSKIFTSNAILTAANHQPKPNSQSAEPKNSKPTLMVEKIVIEQPKDSPMKKPREEKKSQINSDLLDDHLTHPVTIKKENSTPIIETDFDFHVIDENYSKTSEQNIHSASRSPPVELNGQEIPAKKGWYPGKEDPDEIIADIKKGWADEEKKQSERETVKALLDPKINAWAYRSGVRNDIRTLLVTLHTLIWENSGWKPLSISDLIEDSQVKRAYYRAATIVHPDKVQTIKDPKVLYIADRVVHELNKAWDQARVNHFTRKKLSMKII